MASVSLAINLLNSVTALKFEYYYCLILHYEKTSTERLKNFSVITQPSSAEI